MSEEKSGQSIVTRITLAACGAVAVLLILGCLGLAAFEIYRERGFTAEHREAMISAIESRRVAEEKVLKKNIDFTAALLAKSCAMYVYGMNYSGLSETLHAYMEYPEIICVEIYGEGEQPLIAAWKTNATVVDVSLPDDYPLHDLTPVKRDVTYHGSVIGTLVLYYTEQSIVDAVAALRQKTAADLAAFQEAARADLVNVISIQVMGTLIIILILVFSLNGLLKRLVVAPVTHVSDLAGRLADFDLTVTADTARRDEIGRLITAAGRMAESLREIVSTTAASALQISTATDDISEIAQEQVSVATEQSASVSQIHTSVVNLSGAFKKIAEHAGSVTDLADRALADSKEGDQAVEFVMGKIADVSAYNQENIREIHELRNRSKQITKVMKIIRDIAGQTRLIAFNAGIEASGAGQAGKRFGVVAGEIRRLADSVSASTEEIVGAIEGIQAGVDAMIVTSEKRDKAVADVAAYADQTVDKLKRIVDGAQATVTAAGQISRSTRQQKSSFDQIVTAIDEIDKGARLAAESIRRISSITTDLQSLAANLQELIRKFRLPG